MTREEQIVEAGKTAAEGKEFSVLVNKQRRTMSAYEIGFIEGAEWADSHPAWVSVQDELPPKMGKYSKCSNEVLVITERKERFIAKYWYDGTGWVVSGFSTSKLTHWMPLPQPPAKKGGEE